jgi:hypothetical protein
VPGGFSACPYFWLAMFSMLVFKPMIEPFLLGVSWTIRMILKLGGAPILWWDRFVYSKFESSFHEKKGIGIAITGVILIILAILTILVGLLVHSYMFLAGLGSQWTALFWYAVVNSACLIPTTIYIRWNSDNKDRCRVEWYNLVCFIITTAILSASYPAMVMTGLKNIGLVFMAICTIILMVTATVWHALIVSLAFIVKYLSIALVFTAKMLLTAFIILIPALAICAIIGGLGLLLMKFFDKVQLTQTAETNKVKKVSKDDWKDLLYYIYSENEWLKAIFETGIMSSAKREYGYYGETWISTTYRAVYFGMAKKISKKIIEDIKISDALLNIPYSEFEMLKEKTYSVYSLANWKNKHSALGLFLTQVGTMPPDLSQEIYKIKDHISNYMYSFVNLEKIFDKKLQEELKEKIDEANKYISEKLDEIKKEEDRRLALKKKHDEMCKKVSSPIANFFTSLFGGIAFVFSLIFVKFIWQIIVIKGICFTGRQIKIFLVYMWVVLKHLKHGACPYLQFIDPEIEKPKVETK